MSAEKLFEQEVDSKCGEPADAQAEACCLGQKLLELEAKKRGLSSEKLFEQEVDAKAGEPTDGEVEACYLAQIQGHRGSAPGSLTGILPLSVSLPRFLGHFQCPGAK